MNALGEAEALLNQCGSMGHLLGAIFLSPVVGVALLDGRMRFRAVNRTLAAINGIPVEMHLGMKVGQILGPGMSKVEWAIEHVLTTRQPIPHLDFSAKLPGRLRVAQWVASYLPVHDEEGNVTLVAALVLEVANQESLRSSIERLDLSVLQLKSALHFDDKRAASSWEKQTRDRLTHALRLIEHCVSELEGLTRRAIPILPVNNPAANPVSQNLSLRQRQIIRLVAQSKSNKEIAAHLGISVRTAEAHRARLMMKMGFHSVADLVRYAIHHDLVEDRAADRVAPYRQSD